MRDDLASLHAFNRWADGRIVEAARKLSPEQYVREPALGWTSVRATLVHVADATHIWARRIRGEAVSARATEADVPTVGDVARLFAEGHDAFDNLIATVSAERLGSAWSYRNFEGKELSLPLWAIFRHVVNHASYHRGQVASKLGRLGQAPPSTDLVVWAIEQAAK